MRTRLMVSCFDFSNFGLRRMSCGLSVSRASKRYVVLWRCSFVTERDDRCFVHPCLHELPLRLHLIVTDWFFCFSTNVLPPTAKLRSSENKTERAPASIANRSTPTNPACAQALRDVADAIVSSIHACENTKLS